MYERHFGLSKPPFRITPDPEFFFPGANRGAVLEALVYAIARGEGMVKVIGEVGSGKTMLCRMLERELPPHCDIAYLANPGLGPHPVLHAIAFELGLPVAPDEPKLKILHALQEHLLAKHADNRRVVMFVEEAQGMPLATLEEIRLLSNLETTQEKLLQIVLFGQPELDDKLDRHEIRQLRERITHGFELAPLDRLQIRDYITARLRASGYRADDLFTRAALRAIERASGGLLRRINILADKALLAAFAASATTVAAEHVRRAIADSEFGRVRSRAHKRSLTLVLLLVLIVVAVLGWRLTIKREFVPFAWSAASPSSPPAVADPKLSAVRSAADSEAVRASATDPAAAAIGNSEFDDNRTLYPTVSPTTGLVGTEHLRPLGLPPPDLDALRQRWTERPSP